MSKKKLPPMTMPLPFTSPSLITEGELRGIQTAEEQLKGLRAKVREWEAFFEQRQKEVLAKLKNPAGVIIEGRLHAVIGSEPGQCRPEWKTLYLSHMEAKHGVFAEAAEEQARGLYPAKSKEVLVISARPELRAPETSGHS